MESKKKKETSSTVLFTIAGIAILLSIVLLIMFFFGGGESNDLEVSWEGETTGLKCTDSEMLHPVFTDYMPISHTNTIMANFSNDELSTITLYFVGIYNSESEAAQAEAYTHADYGLILAKEYGVSGELFSHSFTIDGEKLRMTITAKNDNINDKVAPYFLLERGKSFPRSLSAMKKRYEEKNFSCEVVD